MAKVEAELECQRQVLQHLSSSDAFRDVFCVEQDVRGIATINGLRLGRLGRRPSFDQVEWSEVNAAWGQAALLLTAVARLIGHSFEKWVFFGVLTQIYCAP